MVTVKVAIQVNARAARPAFISPATKSMRLVVTRAGKSVLNKVANLTPTSTGCSTSLASTTCTLTVSLAAGGYAASVSTFDAIDAKGKLLSLAQNVAFAVKTAGSNVVALTLAGVPKSIAVGSDGSNKFYAVARDPDGNFIVGAGMPKLTVVRSGGSAIVTLVQPLPTSPTEFSVALPKVPVFGTESIGIVASYPAPLANACKQSGAVCSFPSVVTATYGQSLIVANYGDSNILGFTLPLNNAGAATFSTPLVKAYPLVLDPNDTLLVAGYSSAGPLAVYKPPYLSAAVLNTNGIDDPIALALDSKRDAFVANGINTVTEYAPPYSSKPIATISTGIDVPYTVAVDASGKLYVANDANTTVTVYAPPYTSAPVSVTTDSAAFAFAFKGNQLFVGEDGGIYVYNLPLTSASKPVVSNLNATVIDAFAFDAKGNLFATSFRGGASSSGAIVEFTGAFTSSSKPVATISEAVSGTYSPYGLAFDRSGNLYVCNNAGGLAAGGINEYEPPFTNASTPKVALSSAIFYQPYYIAITRGGLLHTTP